MRVIAGSRRGSKLFSPASNAIRPVTDRVKQYIFEILKHIVTGARVLDLFAGTGSLGIEALSRGATSCIFVENSLNGIDLIQRNLTKLKLLDQASVQRESVEHFLQKPQTPFQVIFLDPPYEYPDVLALVTEIDRRTYLHPEGALVIEHDGRIDYRHQVFMNIDLVREKIFGQTIISFFQIKKVSA